MKAEQIQEPVSNGQLNKNKNNSNKNKQEITDKNKTENPMREIEIEKMVLNCGATADKLDKSVKLLEMITKRKILKTKAKKRIPAFAIVPGKEAGCKVTIRNKEEINSLLKRFLVTIGNKIPKKRIADNHFSLGIHEYIEVPGLEYDRDIGILGFEVAVVFKRKGKGVVYKKIKQGRLPKKQDVTKEEIIQYLNKNFGTEVG